MPKGTKAIGSRTKKNKLTEDERYDPTPGGMEWGTPQGTDYFKSLTPGEGKEREKPLKPLNIKARKPEDEKGVKVTEGYWQDRNAKQKETLAKHDKAMIDSAKKSIKKYDVAKKIKENLDLSHIEDKQADHSKHQYPINNEVETFDTGDKDHWLTGKDGEWYIEQDDVKELDKEADNFTFDNALDMGLYDNDELVDEDFDGDPHNDVEITEALSVQGRLKRRFHARRNKAKLKVARRIALRRGSTPDRLKRRATRGARLMVYKRLLRGRDRGSLPPAEKARVEKMITRFQPLVNRISIKLLPQMRKNEIKRLTGRGKLKAKSSKKFKAAKAVKSASSKKTKRFSAPKGKAKYKAPKRKAFKSKIKSGGPTVKKASKAYKAFSYSVG